MVRCFGNVFISPSYKAETNDSSPGILCLSPPSFFSFLFVPRNRGECAKNRRSISGFSQLFPSFSLHKSKRVKRSVSLAIITTFFLVKRDNSLSRRTSYFAAYFSSGDFIVALWPNKCLCTLRNVLRLKEIKIEFPRFVNSKTSLTGPKLWASGHFRAREKKVGREIARLPAPKTWRNNN